MRHKELRRKGSVWNTWEMMNDFHQVGRSQLNHMEPVKDSNRMEEKKFESKKIEGSVMRLLRMI